MRTIFSVLILSLAVSACGSDFLDPDPRSFNQLDRMGRPAINTVFTPTGQEDAFNLATPAQDVAMFTDNVVNFLVNVAGFTQMDAEALAAVLLPDILTIDATSTAGFLNGRRLADDVITAELMIIFGTNTDLNDDNVDANDAPFLNAFPFLGPPFLQ